jgi:hypothetical protein
MLTINIQGPEAYNRETNEFTCPDAVEVEFEHSLVSLSKWESKYQVAFLDNDQKTKEQIQDYIRFMVLTPGVSDEVFGWLTTQDYATIEAYINSSETATTFPPGPPEKGPVEKVTAELVYYWMTAFRIDWQAQHWHLNKLLTLIRVCNVKSNPPKKRSQQELAQWYREENARRLAASGKPG